MANVRDCIASLQAAAAGYMSPEDITSLVAEVDSRAKIMAADRKLASTEEMYDDALAEVVNDMDVFAFNKRREQAINLRLDLNNFNGIITEFGDDLAKGYKSMLTGTLSRNKGARLHLDARQRALSGKYRGAFYGALESKGVMNAYRSGSLDDDIAEHLWRRGGGEFTAKELKRDAVVVADIIWHSQEKARLDANQAGADIGSITGWITRTSHDVGAMKRGGLSTTGYVKIGMDADRAYALWRNFMEDTIDMDRTVPVDMDKEAFFQETYKGLVTGVHMKNNGANQGFTGSANLAGRMSKHRVFHFKDSASWLAYNRKFGLGNLRESIDRGLQHSAENTAAMRTFGTNPEAAMVRLKDKLISHASEKGDLKQVAKLQGKGLINREAEVLGKTKIAGNALGATIGKNIRALNSLTSLGMSGLSAIGDTVFFGNGTRHLRGEGPGGIKSLFQGYSELFTGALKSVGGNRQRRELSSMLGVMADSMSGSMAGKFSIQDNLDGVMARGMRTFFKLNLLDWMTTSTRQSAVIGMSHHFGMKRGMSHAQLTPELRASLNQYNIDAGKWDMLRGVSSKEADGKFHVIPENVKDISDAQIKKYLGSQELGPNQLARFRNDLEDGIRSYYVDNVDFMAITPNAEINAIMKQGTQPGTVPGEAMRFIMQFKAFPTSVMQNVVGRDIMAGKAGGEVDFVGLIHMMVMSTVMGYVALTAKDYSQGKTARDVDSAWFESFVQGGAGGLYADALFGQSQKFGKDPLAALLGPTADKAGGALGIANRMVQGEDFGAQAYRWLRQNTPGQNLIGLKVALDYMFADALQQWANPGYQRRLKRRMRRDNGQSYWIPGK